MRQKIPLVHDPDHRLILYQDVSRKLHGTEMNRIKEALEEEGLLEVTIEHDDSITLIITTLYPLNYSSIDIICYLTKILKEIHCNTIAASSEVLFYDERRLCRSIE